MRGIAMEEKKDAPAPNLGIELVAGYGWGIRRATPENCILTLAHPRFGLLSYLVAAGDIPAWIAAFEKVKAAPPNPIPTGTPLH
jgi:hypothetical protein